MNTSTVKPATASWVSPYLTVRDVAKMQAFYQSAFGFVPHSHHAGPDGVTPVHAEMHWQGELIMIGMEGAYGSETRTPASSGVPCPINMYCYCENVDALHERAVAAGAVSVVPPQDAFWGDRMCCLSDPDGHRWTFATHIAQKAA